MNKNRNLTYATLIVLIVVVAIIIVRACTPPNPPTLVPIPPEGPSVPPQAKPSLAFSRPVPQPWASLIGTVFGYTFQDGAIALKLAAFKSLQNQPFGSLEQYGGLTAVGLVEIGAAPGSETQREVYVVMIPLDPQGSVVRGQLVPITTSLPTGPTGTPVTVTGTPATSTPFTGAVTPFTETGTPVAGTTLEITFQRIPQILNPERTDSPYDEFKTLKPPPDIRATITPHGICFAVNMAGAPKADAAYNLFCSLPSQPGQPASPLSVVDNFQSQYANLQTSINTTVDRLKEQGIFEPEVEIQPDQIVSEKEDAQRLRACAEAERAGQSQQSVQQVCGSDIAFAPVETEYFQRKLREAKIQFAVPGNRLMLAAPFVPPFQQENRVSVPAGALQVFETIQTPDGPIEPGAYETAVWYANGVFYAVTLTGITTDNRQVTDQPLYAVPSETINASSSSSPQSPAQASALLIWGGYCILFECG